MKNKIDFYHQEFRPVFSWVTGNHLFLLTGLCILFSASIYGGLYAWYSDAETAVKSIVQSVKQEQQNIDEFTSALQTRENNPVLGARLRQLQNQIASQESLLLKVKDMDEMRDSSFAELFDALSSADSDHVWLTSFTVNEADLVISGTIAKPSALTVWINDLSSTQFFKGQEFDDALLIREDGELSFHLTSTEKPKDVLLAKEDKRQTNTESGGSDASN